MPFSKLNLHPSLLSGIKELGFARPTPIQAEAIPPALEGKDVLACAMTGSGKTVAFLLPILQKLIAKPRGANPPQLPHPPPPHRPPPAAARRQRRCCPRAAPRARGAESGGEETRQSAAFLPGRLGDE